MGRFNLSHWAVTHQPLVLFLMILLSFGGVLSYFNLGRAEEPDFTVKIMIVSAQWPGATAEEMQRQVADPIEKVLQEIPHFDKVKTYSRPGSTFMQVQFKDDTPPKDVPALFLRVRDRVSDARASLPAGVIGPFFNDDFADVSSTLYMLTGDEGVSARTLKDEAEDIRQQLLRVPDVAKVLFFGEQDDRIYVEFSHTKLATLGITPDQIFASVARQNAVAPAGRFESNADQIYLRVDGALDGEKAVADVPISAGGRQFRLGDIATVHRGPPDPPTYLVRQQGVPALGIGVVMAKGANILDLGENLHSTIDHIRADLPAGLELIQIADQPKIVEESVGEFVRVFMEALVIVLGVSFLSLGIRTGIVVAFAVPLVLAITIMIMDFMGLSLQRVTLGALIIALGLLVDDAIIAVEMMVVKMEQGFDRIAAASYAWTSTAFPMLTGTLVTAAGFMPVGLSQSSTSEYAGGIFWVVAIALLVSWVVAVVFTPYLGVKLLPNFKAHHGDPNAVYDTRVYRALRRVVAWCVRHRIVVVLATLALFASAIFSMRFVQQQFFPTSARPEVIIEVATPLGSAFGTTDAAVRKIEKLVAADDEVETYTSYIGSGAPRWMLGFNPELPKESYGVVIAYAKDFHARDRVIERLRAEVGDGAVPEATVRVSELVFGPPVGYPVQFRVIGPDPIEVRHIAGAVRKVMEANPNTRDVNLDWNEQAKSIRIELDQDRIRALGLTPADIGSTLQTLLSGTTVTQVRDGIELVDVVARAVPEERLDLRKLRDLTITTRDGIAVPLSQVAKADFGFEEPILWRQNRDMVITVRSDVMAGLQPPDVSAQIEPALKPIIEALPMGYRIEAGGSVEESAKANTALAKIFPIMVAVMLLFIMIQVQSFGRLFLVIATAPLGLIGAVYGLILFDRPFGFVTLLGVLSLAGMIMRNTLILVDQIKHDLDAGVAPFEAVIGSTVRRARPVVLTAAAAILAMIPLSQNIFWGPMAVSIMGGLTVATLLTLFFVPALYALCFRVREGAAPVAATSNVAAEPRLAAE
ncbi:Multidrug efflux pump subunit AcrB [Pseudoxanthobacter soli DSM 19599]|uniref:Multidrug efflux pump subunit AcrB n=1 Tax=Pseudoxanthobacter soli DSM 19599 TaxID=1123029 RepID=A0A1M7ZKZ8_9HYPH|nr:efflux RND transporter permease subunit [Pseudoxanthobacter soli]SHO65585.1 Multidrug efflux pump subunit AcrB [Pseudoxanthobacter soli DSM 19599]